MQLSSIYAVQLKVEKMDIRDFQGGFKYKLIIPAITIMSIVMAFLGPIYYPGSYASFAWIVSTYSFIRGTIVIWSTTKMYFSWEVIKKKVKAAALRTEEDTHLLGQSLNHYAFIIPNYNEAEEMLSETIERLAVQPRAKGQYLIFLAMEAAEKGSVEKAERICAKFQSRFKGIDYTVHTIREYEQRGKASNVSWCAENMEPFFQKRFVNEKYVTVVIQDADSWLPAPFIEEVEEHLVKNDKQRHEFIFSPPQIYTRENVDTPIMIDNYDSAHSFVHATNLYSPFGVCFPLSNYALSYQLIKKVGYWDTCADAIGEDYHMTQKCFWKTHGKIQMISVFTPVNQSHLSAGKGFLKNYWARFWQSERHSQGMGALGCIFMHFQKNMNVLKAWPFMWLTFENYLIPATLPYLMLSYLFQSVFLNGMLSMDIRFELMPMLMSSMLQSIGFTYYFIYEKMKRESSELFYGITPKDSWPVAAIKHLVLITPNTFLITVISYFVATFHVLRTDRIYHGAVKHYEKVTVA